jgi:hypothetical protein
MAMKQSNVWKSEYQVLEPEIHIDSLVYDKIKGIQTHVGDDEFSILLKGTWAEGGYFYVSSEYYIPLQTSSPHAVDYKVCVDTEEEAEKLASSIPGASWYKDGLDFHVSESLSCLRDAGFNTILHSHPFSDETAMSYSDKEHVIQHFPCSLLSNKSSDIVDGHLQLTGGESTVVSVNIKEFTRRYGLDTDIDMKIHKKVHTLVQAITYSYNNTKKLESEIDTSDTICKVDGVLKKWDIEKNQFVGLTLKEQIEYEKLQSTHYGNCEYCGVYGALDNGFCSHLCESDNNMCIGDDNSEYYGT